MLTKKDVLTGSWYVDETPSKRKSARLQFTSYGAGGVKPRVQFVKKNKAVIFWDYYQPNNDPYDPVYTYHKKRDEVLGFIKTKHSLSSGDFTINMKTGKFKLIDTYGRKSKGKIYDTVDFFPTSRIAFPGAEENPYTDLCRYGRLSKSEQKANCTFFAANQL